MRRRRSRLVLRAGAVGVMAAGGGATVPRALPAQVSESGAAFLLFPVAARSVGVGGAHVADTPGSEAVLANPAALGRQSRAEAALHYGEDIVTSRFLAGVAYPAGVLGTFAASAFVTNFGETTLTDPQGNPTGEAVIRSLYYAGSYASTIGRRAAIGVTYKYIQTRFDCTGECNDPLVTTRPSTSALDLGVQYDLTGRVPLVLGLAVRNLGLRLQVTDRAQADPLPTQAAIGARYVVPNLARYVTDTEVRVLGELDTGLGARQGGRVVRVGAEGVYRQAFALRAGYVATRGESGGPSIGLGYATSRVAFDLARQLTGFSVDAGEPPTYVALRYRF